MLWYSRGISQLYVVVLVIIMSWHCSTIPISPGRVSCVSHALYQGRIWVIYLYTLRVLRSSLTTLVDMGKAFVVTDILRYMARDNRMGVLV